MTNLGIRDRVMYIMNQVGWPNFVVRRRCCSCSRLNLEFLSSLFYKPNHGLEFNRGLILFKMFGMDHCFPHCEMAELLGFPSGLGDVTITQENPLLNLSLLLG